MLKLSAVVLGVLILSAFAKAQVEDCYDAKPESRPGRPAITNGADPTQCGVMELEYGADHSWAKNSHGNSIAGGIRFGITPDLDLHWSAGDFLQISDQDGDHRGFGDNWLGFAYRYLKQGRRRPSLGVMYMAKIPTGDPDQELGTGEVDHALSFLLSKDFRRFHFDFNVGPQWWGVAHRSPDHNLALSTAASIPATKRLTLVLESYGQTELNPETPAFASLMTGCSLRVNPRLYLDAGFDKGLTADAPGARVFTGITVAVANFYTWMRPREYSSAKQVSVQNTITKQ